MKLRSLFKYECLTIAKPLGIFYSILYGIVLAGYIVDMIVGNNSVFRFNGVEFSCVIFLCICASLGFSEDFRFLLQNGFTRNSIFCGTFMLYLSLSFFMSAVDTLIAMLLNQLSGYRSLFHQLYGADHSIFLQWLLLSCFYFTVSAVSYLFRLLSDKMGHKLFLVLMIGLAVFFFIFVPYFISTVLSESAQLKVLDFFGFLAGFTKSSHIHFYNPILICIGISCIGFLPARSLLKKMELKQ